MAISGKSVNRDIMQPCQNSAGLFWRYLLRTDTYPSMTSGGNLNLISDFELMQDLITLYKTFRDSKIQDDVYWEYMNEYVIPFLYKQADRATQKLDSPKILNTLKFQNLIIGYPILLRQNLREHERLTEFNAGKRLSGQ